MQHLPCVLSPPNNAPSPPAPLPRVEWGEAGLRPGLPDESGRFDTPQFDGFRIGPDVQWLWPGRIPHGMVTLIAGAEGAGKSFVALDIAARVSRGLGWPGLPQAASSKNEESLGKQGVFQRPVRGPLPRDGYARRQERKRRQRERENARQRKAGS